MKGKERERSTKEGEKSAHIMNFQLDSGGQLKNQFISWNETNLSHLISNRNGRC